MYLYLCYALLFRHEAAAAAQRRAKGRRARGETAPRRALAAVRAAWAAARVPPASRALVPTIHSWSTAFGGTTDGVTRRNGLQVRGRAPANAGLHEPLSLLGYVCCLYMLITCTRVSLPALEQHGNAHRGQSKPQQWGLFVLRCASRRTRFCPMTSIERFGLSSARYPAASAICRRRQQCGSGYVRYSI